jgi:hypothetical protein
MLLYMYVGGIAVILCIYVWVLIDSCGALSNNSSRDYDSEDDVPTTDDNENPGPLTRFGSLKRAHRAGTTGTSFYIRVGAICKYRLANYSKFQQFAKKSWLLHKQDVALCMLK